ncbi:Hypothetical predicted protein [Marmota monax]|uniref:Uncharacterized protein n=1 Tax=Marmota monax TaxID=9995 RepID=A0A5E4ARZ4_MARMO|nr:Hypothetical predicted protein [Marmota monax]
MPLERDRMSLDLWSQRGNTLGGAETFTHQRTEDVEKRGQGVENLLGRRYATAPHRTSEGKVCTCFHIFHVFQEQQKMSKSLLVEEMTAV